MVETLYVVLRSHFPCVCVKFILWVMSLSLAFITTGYHQHQNQWRDNLSYLAGFLLDIGVRASSFS